METTGFLTNKAQRNMMVTVITIFSADDAYSICLMTMRPFMNAKVIQPLLQRNRISQRQLLLVLLLLTLLYHCPDWLKTDWNELAPMELAEEFLRLLQLISSVLARCGYLPLHPTGVLHVVGEENAFRLADETGAGGSADREKANLPPSGKETQHPSSERAATGQADGYGTNGPSNLQPEVSQSVPGQKPAPDIVLMDLIVQTALTMKESQIDLNQLTNLLTYVDYQCGNKYKEQIMRLFLSKFKQEPGLPQGQPIVINHIRTQIGTVTSGAVGAVNMDKE